MERRLMFAVGAIALTVGPTRLLFAQQSPDTRLFSPGELDQMLAPVALYPDALLAQVLMASTYPIEVNEAAAWSRAHPNLAGNAAVGAVGDEPWDVSVKSLVAFPQVLDMMGGHFDWTQKMGDAQLGQPQDVADSIQRLRAEAAAAGNLSSGSQYAVSTMGSGDQVQYVITPVNPSAIYVPYYNPRWAYGRWRWADYPPYYWAPDRRWNYGAVGASGYFWGIAIVATLALFGGWEWRHGRSAMYVDYDRAYRIDRRFDRARYVNNAWNHDPVHRGGVVYRDTASRQRYSQWQGGVDQREPYRGRTQPTNTSTNGTTHTAGPPSTQSTHPPGQTPPHAPTSPPASNPPGHTAPQTQHTSVSPPAGQTTTHSPPPAGTQAPHNAPPPNSTTNRSPPPIASPHTNALSGVNRGSQVQHEASRGQQQQTRVATHTPSPPPPPPPPAHTPPPQTHSTTNSGHQGTRQ